MIYIGALFEQFKKFLLTFYVCVDITNIFMRVKILLNLTRNSTTREKSDYCLSSVIYI